MNKKERTEVRTKKRDACKNFLSPTRLFYLAEDFIQKDLIPKQDIS